MMFIKKKKKKILSCLPHLQYYSTEKNWFDWISNSREKKSQSLKWTFGKKRAIKLKTIKLLHFMAAFPNFAFEIKTSWAKRSVKPLEWARS